MSNAQEYLAKVVPWPQDGDPPAYINIHWSTTSLNRKGKPFWSGRAVRSVKDADSTIKWALGLDDVKDIYVCMSSQRVATEKVSKAGNKYLLPFRAQDNVVALKSFFVDLDAKGKAKGSYDTLEEAFTALAAFIQAIGLPGPNVVVKTGGGLHVYWTVERALTLSEWQPLSHALAAALKAHGVLCDTGCTIDSARVLRIPDTYNCKLDVRRPVILAGGRTGGDYLLARFAGPLAPYIGMVPTPAAAAPPAWAALFPPKTPITDDDKLSSGIQSESAPIPIDDVAAECPFVHEAVTSGGKDFDNPLWNLTTLIATFTEDGRGNAHDMACGHATYSKDETDDLYDRKERDRKSKGVGWPACRTIQASGYAGCQACPHLVANRSPLYFAATQPQAPSPASSATANGHTSTQGLSGVNDLPGGYSRLPSGVVCQIITDAQGKQSLSPITGYPFMAGAFLTNVDGKAHLNFHSKTKNGGNTLISLPTEIITTRELSKVLGGQRILLHDEEAKNVRRFLVSWIQVLQMMKDRNIDSAPYGWVENGKGSIEGFVFGGTMWMPNGDRIASMPDVVLARRYTPTGTIDPWKDAAKLITSQQRPALDAIIASAFAAPLIRFCYEPGILMSTYSTRSGVGKTSTMKIAQAVWGSPMKAMQGLDDTLNGVIKKIGQLQNIPLYWDELKTEEQAKRFTKLVFSLTHQKEKDRLTRTAAMLESGSWQTLLVSASNDSIMDYVVRDTKQTAAGIYRVFEYEVPAALNGFGQIDQADASRIVGKLNNNYGCVGLEYARYLGSNHAFIEKDVEDFYKSVGNEVDSINEERFWRVILATLLKGAEYANHLGFTQINYEALKAFLFGVVIKLRAEKDSHPVDMEQSVNISNVLAQFFHSMHRNNTLRTNRVHTLRGKPPTGSIVIKTIQPDRLDAIRVHVGEDDKIVRISETFFREWLSHNRYSAAMILKAMGEEYGATSVKGRMGSGTDRVGAIEKLVHLELAKNPDINFIDEA